MKGARMVPQLHQLNAAKLWEQLFDNTLEHKRQSAVHQLADMNLSQMYQHQHISCLCADMQTFFFREYSAEKETW